MKRGELTVGESYALLSGNSRLNRYTTAPRFIVLSTEPSYYEVGRSWRESGYEAGAKKNVHMLNGDGERVLVHDIYAEKFDPEEKSYFAKKAKSMVYGLVETHQWNRESRYSLEVVALSKVKMTWADYETKLAELDEAAKAKEKAAAKEAAAKASILADAKARRDKLNEMLEGSALQARVVDGEVGIFGVAADLLDMVEEFMNA